MGESPRYSLTRVVGTGRTEFLVAAELPLPRPAALVLEGRKTVLIDRTDITPGSVLLQGRLRALWIYQALETASVPGNGVVALASGPLCSISADVAFDAAISIPGALPGMSCRVVDAYVSADASEPGQTAIRERSLVVLSVEVTAQEQVQAPAPRPGVVQARGRVIGPGKT